MVILSNFHASARDMSIGLFALQISIEGVRGPSFEGDIAVDSISFIPGRCMTRISDEEIQADSHLGLGENPTTSPRICYTRIKCSLRRLGLFGFFLSY